ncbi:MAG: transposase, partial [Kiritimatiellaeota bacterium]|nr:transposase [Kiritimatiellota bacterium]
MTILNYVATSNHVHLLVYADADRMTIPRSMQLLAGRVAQEFNMRKQRNGAFWEDRYHATAVMSGKHLRRCMTYIDLNMVRAGAVRHPGEWECCGYCEIQEPPRRYRRIDQEILTRLLELRTVGELRAWQRRTVRECLET